MRTHYDVIIVGARVAGSTLAYELSKAGYDVLLLDKTTFPSDTLSTHNFYGNSLAMLREMGVLDALLETGTPTYKRAVVQFEDAVIDGDFPAVQGETDCLCIRRTHLDDILFRHAAAQDRVTAIEGFRMTDVIRAGGGETVTGIAGVRRSGERESYSAKLVVGADGRGSLLREHVGSKCKGSVPTDFASYVGYYSGYVQDGEMHVELYKLGDKIGIVFPTSDGLYVVGIMFPLADDAWMKRFKEWPERAMRDIVNDGFANTPLPRRMKNAELEGPIRGLLGYDNDWYQGMGPGWALVGDAYSFKDPAVGQGMQDALYGARILTDVLSGYPDWSACWAEMAERYQTLMEEKMMFHYHLACQFTKNMPFTAEQTAVNRLIASDPEATRAFLGIYNRATSPQEFESALMRLSNWQV
ncbi:NAD(P)/FAD-dependent oxidoreductase [Paenibacillus sp. LHD-117]|uniref:NAD(P)/FAD-dependent oxidoreductase n=1 Tax=Paenibacillus sp. LHD-117 TaxID=3071412 RepID=UPI0027E13F73|nr:NAD(P)/FAD-dependent oxidoreductase [Paenibacillus sp. LHD-117]MDQ6419660.1 NAD(P)/FAD-dependent oxidoreductase [Paenibacillus sp. LHD-117]